MQSETMRTAWSAQAKGGVPTNLRDMILRGRPQFCGLGFEEPGLLLDLRHYSNRIANCLI